MDTHFSQHHVLKNLSYVDCSRHPGWKSFDPICDGLFLGTLFSSVCLNFYLCAGATLFCYYSFAVSFESRKSKSSRFVLLFQDCFGCSLDKI